MEIVAIAKSAAKPVAEFAFDNCKDWVSCVLAYKENVKKVQELRDKLEARHKDLHDRVADCTRKGQQVAREVHLWLKQMPSLLPSKNTDDDNGWEDMLKDEMARKEAEQCCLGFCSWNPKYRHHLSRIAAEKAVEIKKILQESEVCLSSLTVGTPPPSLNMIMEKLKKNYQESIVIGIHGMGGAGKTTLVEKIAKEVGSWPLFNAVVMVEISRNVDIKKIQGELAGSIDLEMHVDGIRDRAIKLRARLQEMAEEEKEEKEEKKGTSSGGMLLVILDDLWEKLNLHAVGIPSRYCIIVITSRMSNVCKEMGALDGNIFEVGDLLEEEAKDLFRMKIEDKLYHEKESLLTEMLKNYSCLPLSISILADSLRGQNPIVWRSVLKQLNNSISSGQSARVLGTISTVLKLSYDFIDNEDMKQFFLLCCLYPPSCPIKIDDLLRCGIGLGLFQHVNSLVEASDQAREWAENLLSLSLFMDVDFDKREVKIHNEIRAALISFTMEGKYVFRVGAIPRWLDAESYKKFTAISILADDSVEYLSGQNFPKLQLLHLAPTSRSKLHSHYFSGMVHMKVLHLSNCELKTLPKSIGCLKNLVTLLLELCKLDNVSEICNLVKLQVLSFYGSSISRLPKRIKNLVRLKVLDVTRCRLLRKIPVGTIKKLTQLEGLYMNDSFSNWQIEGSMVSLSELKCLPYLCALEIGVASLEQLPYDIFLPSNLSSFKIEIVGSIEEKKHLSFFLERAVSNKALQLEKCSFSRKLKIVGVSGNAIIKKDLKPLFTITESLHLGKVNNLENILPCLSNKNGSRDYKSTNELGDSDVFSELKRLVLFELPNLKQICYKEPSIHLFPNLQEVTLSRLHSLQPYGLPIQVATRLTVLKVMKCEKLKYIFWAAGNRSHEVVEFSLLNRLKLKGVSELLGLFNDKNKPNAKSCKALFTNKMIFPSLLELGVTHFNKGRAFWDVKGEDFTKIFPQLQSIKLDHCPTLSHVWSEKILKGNLSFGKLKHLRIRRCSKLKNVLFPSVANALQELEKLDISYCDLLEQVISTERDVGGDNSAKIIRFPKLTFLYLVYLDGLRCFYKGKSTVEFQALKLLRLENLNMAETFIEELVEEEEGLQAKKVLFNKKTTLPSLEELYLSDLPAIEELWDLSTFKEFFTRFPALKRIDLESLNLKHVWSKVPHGSVIFKKLKHMEIYDCSLIESLFPLSRPSVGTTLEAMSFSHLTTMKLYNLTKFRCLLRGRQKLELPGLRKLLLIDLPSMNTFFEMEKEIISEWEDEKADDNMPILLFNRKVSFPSLEILELGCLDKVVNVLDILSSSDDMIRTRFPKLERLSIWRMPKLKYVHLQSLDQEPRLHLVSAARRQSQASKVICFSKLEKLVLENLYSLRCFVWGNSSMKFQKLKKLEVSNLPMIKIFYKLKTCCFEIMEDTEDKSTEEELTEEELDDEQIAPGLEESKKTVVEDVNLKARAELFRGDIDGFPSLETLIIEDMPELESIWEMDKKEDVAATICSVSHPVGTLLPSLIELELLKLPKLNNVPWQMLPNLRRLVITNCFSGAEFLITPTSILGGQSAAVLQQLESIEITNCRHMRAIVAKETKLQEEEEENIIHEIVFPKVREILLEDMRSLCTFSEASYVLRFPSLEWLRIHRCRLIRSFSPRRPKIQLQSRGEIDGNFFDGDDDLNSILQNQSVSDS